MINSAGLRRIAAWHVGGKSTPISSFLGFLVVTIDNSRRQFILFYSFSSILDCVAYKRVLQELMLIDWRK